MSVSIRSISPASASISPLFGLTKARAARLKPDCLIMHPGPINRGVEIDSEVADGSHSVILEQVTNGLAVRMAVLYPLRGRPGTFLMKVVRITNGRIVDPANQRDEIADIWIAEGIIADASSAIVRNPKLRSSMHKILSCPQDLLICTCTFASLGSRKRKRFRPAPMLQRRVVSRVSSACRIRTRSRTMRERSL